MGNAVTEMENVPTPFCEAEVPQIPNLDTQQVGLASAEGCMPAEPSSVDPQPASYAAQFPVPVLPLPLESSNGFEKNLNGSSLGLAVACGDGTSGVLQQINFSHFAGPPKSVCGSLTPPALFCTASGPVAKSYTSLQQQNLAKLHSEQQAIMQPYMLPTQSSLQHAHSLSLSSKPLGRATSSLHSLYRAPLSPIAAKQLRRSILRASQQSVSQDQLERRPSSIPKWPLVSSDPKWVNSPGTQKRLSAVDAFVSYAKQFSLKYGENLHAENLSSKQCQAQASPSSKMRSPKCTNSSDPGEQLQQRIPWLCQRAPGSPNSSWNPATAKGSHQGLRRLHSLPVASFAQDDAAQRNPYTPPKRHSMHPQQEKVAFYPELGSSNKSRTRTSTINQIEDYQQQVERSPLKRSGSPSSFLHDRENRPPGQGAARKTLETAAVQKWSFEVQHGSGATTGSKARPQMLKTDRHLARSLQELEEKGITVFTARPFRHALPAKGPPNGQLSFSIAQKGSNLHKQNIREPPVPWSPRQVKKSSEEKVVRAAMKPSRMSSCSIPAADALGKQRLGSEVRERVLSDLPSAESDTSESVNHVLTAPIPRGISEPEASSRQPRSKSWLRVMCRLRPVQGELFLRQTGNATVCADNSTYAAGSRSFMFHEVIPPDVSNSILAGGFADVMKSIVEGTGAAFLALGHPDSGKTYTMLGSLQPRKKQRLRGLVGLLGAELLEGIQKACTSCRIHMTAFEIMDEQIRDLLTPSNAGATRMGLAHDVVTDKSTTCWVTHLECVEVGNLRQFEDALQIAAEHRTTSSPPDGHGRASLVISLIITQPDAKGTGMRTSKVTFAEVSGGKVEKVIRISSYMSMITSTPTSPATACHGVSRLRREGPSKGRRRGGGLGNQQLEMWALGEVLWAARRMSCPVPYRLCKLTRYLQDVVQGRGHVIAILCVDPSATARMQTLSTLTVGNRMLGRL
eukprot:jgi/Botrbrau1/9286/Bobra.0111s0013.2